MKIDFVISSLQGGGAERVLSLVANSLAENTNYVISVLTLYPSDEAYDIHPQINKLQFKKNYYIPILTLSSFLNLFKYYRKKSNRPDVMISFSTNTNLLTILIAKIFSIKIIGQEHIAHIRAGQETSNKIKFTRKFIYKYANVITVLTSFDIEYYKRLGVNVMVMPNPCSFKPIEENSHNRDKVILAVGNLNRYHHKGFDNLISIMVPIFAEYPDWRMKIAGSGDEGLKHLTELAREKNILDKIAFIGFKENISEVMYNSSIFVLPSRFEGLPMVLLEAMSQGMACIAYNCKTGPSDIITDNENGLLIEDQNIEKMQLGLRKLLDNKEYRATLANRGIRSLKKYDISEITNRYEMLFAKLENKS